jgi:hypothetical protein
MTSGFCWARGHVTMEVNSVSRIPRGDALIREVETRGRTSALLRAIPCPRALRESSFELLSGIQKEIYLMGEKFSKGV